MLGRDLARAAHGILDAGQVLEDVYERLPAPGICMRKILEAINCNAIPSPYVQRNTSTGQLADSVFIDVGSGVEVCPKYRPLCFSSLDSEIYTYHSDFQPPSKLMLCLSGLVNNRSWSGKANIQRRHRSPGSRTGFNGSIQTSPCYPHPIYSITHKSA